ncbi:monofunctional biosynthetic peptidoglycan transglycosylase [Coralloluteibacterium thermophilus]|uniref:Biosynthetic peptidoglycan transglycosylase n=1 Tax=Coralloluteibacterium thermophilum TaxID=2707049 RepID=A0ABV9NIA6_9GAMM
MGTTEARRKRRWLRRLWRVPVLAVGMGLLLSILQVLALRWIDPPTSAYMLARLAAPPPAAGQPRVDFRWVPLEAVAPALPLAVVAAEDQRFPDHRGFDLDAIRAALDSNEDGGALRGASTISQQVARNLYLWSGRSWLRKGLEAWYTFLIEALWPKRRILEVYVNIAEFGDGIYGAEAAAQRYFGKSAAALGEGEAARLAAVLPSPRRWSVEAPGPYVQRRTAWIQRQMRQLGGPAYLDGCCAP